ncbi:hypothetical protein [Campylobacter upsaliensis]|uniref:hypothetical protein n=1 Tax=Campylobacter upsaliensis TaxID=28080 RepID=UPI0022EB072F|nr:hypothetical protein [Campylobacter upsaliensis]MEB2821918.1 hypothetical protein [Campylobacter upsaliensis]
MADILKQQEINTLLEIADNMSEVDNLAEKIAKLMRERDRLNNDIVDLTFRLQNLGYLWVRSESECKTIDIIKLNTRRIVASK